VNERMVNDGIAKPYMGWERDFFQFSFY
jgi:hypothetical protein